MRSMRRRVSSGMSACQWTIHGNRRAAGDSRAKKADVFGKCRCNRSGRIRASERFSSRGNAGLTGA